MRSTLLAPVLAYALGVALYSEGEALFWRTLAYLAVFHFVRQQYGWVALYRARGRRARTRGLVGGRGGRLHGDALPARLLARAPAAPLLVVPAGRLRRSSPSGSSGSRSPLYCAALGAYAVRSAHAWVVGGRGNPGKDVVVLTTAVCWYVGIVAFNSDYAFTVTNVFIHGVPYVALVWWYARRRAPEAGTAYRRLARWPVFLATLWLLAYAEELLWDRGVWHERAWLFGGGVGLAVPESLPRPAPRAAAGDALRARRLHLAS